MHWLHEYVTLKKNTSNINGILSGCFRTGWGGCGFLWWLKNTNNHRKSSNWNWPIKAFCGFLHSAPGFLIWKFFSVSQRKDQLYKNITSQSWKPLVFHHRMAPNSSKQYCWMRWTFFLRHFHCVRDQSHVWGSPHHHTANLRFGIDASAPTIPSCIVGNRWVQPGVCEKQNQLDLLAIQLREGWQKPVSIQWIATTCKFKSMESPELNWYLCDLFHKLPREWTNQKQFFT